MIKFFSYSQREQNLQENSTMFVKTTKTTKTGDEKKDGINISNNFLTKNTQQQVPWDILYLQLFFVQEPF